MSSTSHIALSLRHRLLYFLARMRGKNAAEASDSARQTAMRKIGKMVDARTQTLAKHICTNC